MKKNILVLVAIIATGFLYAQRPMEYLDRGLVAMETDSYVYLSWRMLGTDNANIGFNIYRNATKINISPITATTNFSDVNGTVTDTYYIETIQEEGGVVKSKEVAVWALQPPTENPGKDYVPFKHIPLPDPPVLDGATFIPGDMSVGDLDGDGDYELIFEWESSTTRNSFIEAIDLDGNSLWRINGGHNTSTNKLCFMVYDLDQDGKAEVACKTGPGTMDGTGSYLSLGPAATDDDSVVLARHNNETHLLEDPAYITVFNGETGKEMTTVNYWPSIGAFEDMYATWGDSYGKRSSSIKSAVLYDKNLGPLLVFSRGIYTRIAMRAYTWNGTRLAEAWTFDSNDYPYPQYNGEGNHSVCVGDVDNDGSDELIYGACAINNDGTGLYSTLRGHGDSHHLGDHDPDRSGLEYFQPHEDDTHGISMRDAATGEILWEYLSADDIGRGWAADVDPNHRGAEISAVTFPNYDTKGNEITTEYNAYYQPIYFDGDVQRELRKGMAINGVVGGPSRIFTGWYYGAETLHGTKQDANLVADILGDWREEVIFKHMNNTELLLFSTWLPTARKNYTLMHDPTYRMNIVVQNVGYNQPSNVGYYFPDGAPDPNIYMINDQTLGVNDVIKDIDLSEMDVYPNPVDKYLNIDLKKVLTGDKYVTMYNILGEDVYNTQTNKNHLQINTQTYKEGLYFVNVSGGNQAFNIKVVIKH